MDARTLMELQENREIPLLFIEFYHIVQKEINK